MTKLEDSIFSVFFNEDAENIEEGFFSNVFGKKKTKEEVIDPNSLVSPETAKKNMERYEKIMSSAIRDAERFFKGMKLTTDGHSLAKTLREYKPNDRSKKSGYVTYELFLTIIKFTGDNATKLANAISHGKESTLSDIDGYDICTYLEKYTRSVAKKNGLIEEDSTYGIYYSEDDLISFNFDEDYEAIHLGIEFRTKITA